MVAGTNDFVLANTNIKSMKLHVMVRMVVDIYLIEVDNNNILKKTVVWLRANEC